MYYIIFCTCFQCYISHICFCIFGGFGIRFTILQKKSTLPKLWLGTYIPYVWQISLKLIDWYIHTHRAMLAEWHLASKIVEPHQVLFPKGPKHVMQGGGEQMYSNVPSRVSCGHAWQRILKKFIKSMVLVCQHGLHIVYKCLLGCVQKFSRKSQCK